MTNDITRLSAGVALYAALLTPQGKILFDFLIAEGDGAVLLDCAADAAPALARKLSLYRLRAKVEIELRPQLGVYVGLSGKPAIKAISFADPRAAILGPRAIAAKAEMPAGLGDAASYHAVRLAMGIPEGGDFGSDRIFALDAGLDELHAIAFDKGCYVGQELTARMKHRGTARKRLMPVMAASALPAPGAPVSNGEMQLGEIFSTYGARGFALVRMDRLAEANGALTSDGVSITITRPNWLKG